MTDPRPDPDARPVMGDHPEMEVNEPTRVTPDNAGDGRPGWLVPGAIALAIVVIVVILLVLV